MAAFTYLIGRRRRDLANLLKQSGEAVNERDKVFAGTRLDEQNINAITNGTFSHCTFANVGFKKVALRTCNFEDCVFIGCYFRKAIWQDCRFQACRFIDCQLTGLQITGTSFFYSRFSDCFIPFSRIRNSLPAEANLKREMAHNLAMEASKLGFYQEARTFRWCEIEANEEVLRGALRQEEQYYVEHYPRLRDQMRAGLALAISRLNRALWGYGEKGRVLIRNFAILMLLVFPFVFFLLSRTGDLHKDAGNLSITDIISFSVQHILEPTVSSGVTPNGLAFWIAALEGFLGLMIAGLVVSYLFQWILRR